MMTSDLLKERRTGLALELEIRWGMSPWEIKRLYEAWSNDSNMRLPKGGPFVTFEHGEPLFEDNPYRFVKWRGGNVVAAPLLPFGFETFRPRPFHRFFVVFPRGLVPQECRLIDPRTVAVGKFAHDPIPSKRSLMRGNDIRAMLDKAGPV